MRSGGTFSSGSCDLLLEEDDQNQQPDAHKLIEDDADEAHLEYFGSNHPHDDEGHHTIENVDGAGFFHQAVDIE